ncbi:hypothetical protein B0H13DRAFT_2026054 [Mycena leptocephala]|nr:hypothetical protein B0H13DRAFT_2026054 [Mycena leptocephala]
MRSTCMQVCRTSSRGRMRYAYTPSPSPSVSLSLTVERGLRYGYARDTPRTQPLRDPRLVLSIYPVAIAHGERDAGVNDAGRVHPQCTADVSWHFVLRYLLLFYIVSHRIGARGHAEPTFCVIPYSTSYVDRWDGMSPRAQYGTVHTEQDTLHTR